MNDGRSEDPLVPEDDRAIGRFFRWSIALFGLAAMAVGAAWQVAHRAPAEEAVVEAPVAGPRAPEPVAAVAPPSVEFRDVTKASGIDFVHENGATGDKLLPETMGGGCAFFDADADGDPDLLLVNSTLWGADSTGPTTAFYLNDGSGRFENASAGSGLDVSAYGMGVAVGDYDADGLVDVFLTSVGRNRLFRNQGGRFREVTESAGVAGDADAWSTGAAFLDYDRDGDLDLFVVNYVRWSAEIDFEIDFQLTGIGRAYGPPTTFEGTYPNLYRNDGDGTFTDVSAQGGVQVANPATGLPVAKSLAVAPVDVDLDGWIDLLVANDTVQNQFFHNRGDGSFEEQGVRLGIAFDRNGSSTGAMGIDTAWFRNDADLGVAIGNFANEMTSFYVSQGTPLQLADEAIGTGIGPPSRLALTFGLFFFDYDLDGRLDLLQVNGHLEDEINRVQPSQSYEQSPQLFWNAGPEAPRTFVAVPAASSGDLAAPLVGRAAAFADIDSDGDLDILITQVGRRPQLLRNDQDLGNHWLRVRLIGSGANRDAIGARVDLVTEGTRQRRLVMPTRSYLSQVELPITFGLGASRRVESLTVTWPDGSTRSIANPAIDSVLVVEQEP